MRAINIVGCGPTGMTIAWELSKNPENRIKIFEKKQGPGGSWWEPDDHRSLHAYRAVFNNGFVNTQNLFREMGLDWNDYFGKLNHNKDELYTFLFKNLYPKDYLELLILSIKVLTQQEFYKTKTLHESIGQLTKSGEQVVTALPFVMDGVSWDQMTAFEFVKSFDWVGLSSHQTQITSGSKMSRDIERVLRSRNVEFYYDTEISEIFYDHNGHVAVTSDNENVYSDLLVLAIDNGSAQHLMKDNWGKQQLSTYTSVTFTISYSEEVSLSSEIVNLVRTPWHILTHILPDKKTICIVLVDLDTKSPHTGRSVSESPPGEIIEEVHRQIPDLQRGIVKFCWGSTWKGNTWVHSQTSGVISTGGQVPFFGKCPNVALCGMMSPRSTPFASLEAAVEVGKTFVGSPVSRPLLVTDILIIFLILFIFYKARNFRTK